LLLSQAAFSQSVEKVIFNPKDTTAGHYLPCVPAERPSGESWYC
jgi:hypothetical protein